MTDQDRPSDALSQVSENVEQLPPEVGKRIRGLREQRGLSLRALAARSGLSINAISLIERGVNSPTVSSLHLLATTLGVSITEFFRNDEVRSTIFVRRGQRSRARRGHMDIESLGVGLRYQQLGPFMVTLRAGRAGEDFDPISHGGQEFVYCVEGEIAYQIGPEVYTLETGDTLLFEASQPHRFWNTGAGEARILLVFASRDGDQDGHHQHIGT